MRKKLFLEVRKREVEECETILPWFLSLIRIRIVCKLCNGGFYRAAFIVL